MKILCLVILAAVLDVSLGYRWCCKSNAELTKCNHFRILEDLDGNHVFDFDCVFGNGTAACMDMIRNGHADVIDLDGGDVFGYRDDVNVIAAEDYGNGDSSYYAVAMVKKSAREDLTLDNLAGARTCHTAVGKTAGWNMPMGWLWRNNHDPSLFRSSCAPGARISPYTSLLPPDDNPDKWCSLCIGNSLGQHVCDRDQDERYYGYGGAIRCMQDGAGEVAFVSHLAALAVKQRNQYKLLCPDGKKRATVDEWFSCTMGKVPSHAVVMSKRATADDAADVFHRLNVAHSSIPKRIFNKYGGKDLLWGSKIVGFIQKNRVDPANFVGHEYFCNIYALQSENHANHPSCQ